MAKIHVELDTSSRKINLFSRKGDRIENDGVLSVGFVNNLVAVTKMKSDKKFIELYDENLSLVDVLEYDGKQIVSRNSRKEQKELQKEREEMKRKIKLHPMN